MFKKLLPFSGGSSDTSFKRFSVVGDLTGTVVITVPKGRTVDPLKEKEDEVSCLILKDTIAKYKDFSLDTVIDLWCCLSYLGFVKLEERETGNSFSSKVSCVHTYDGQGELKFIDQVDLILPLQKSQFDIDITCAAGKISDLTYVYMQIQGKVVITEDSADARLLNNRKIVNVFKSDTMESLPREFAKAKK